MNSTDSDAEERFDRYIEILRKVPTLVVDDRFEISNGGIAVTGVLLSGTIRTGDRLGVYRQSQLIGEATVIGIELNRKLVSEAFPTESIGLLLRQPSNANAGDTLRRIGDQ